jgi:hypothetical protein
MGVWQGILIGLGAALLAYVLFVVWLIVAGRKEEARAVAGLVPDFVVLFRRLLSDGRVSRPRKVVLAALAPISRCPSTSCPTSFPSLATWTMRSSSRSCCAMCCAGAGPS